IYFLALALTNAIKSAVSCSDNFARFAIPKITFSCSSKVCFGTYPDLSLWHFVHFSDLIMVAPALADPLIASAAACGAAELLDDLGEQAINTDVMTVNVTTIFLIWNKFTLL